MMSLEELSVWTKKVIKLNPSLEEDITGLYDWCLSEIESGESISNEIHLFTQDVENLDDIVL